MEPHPGRIADDECEAAARGDVGEVDGKREGKRAARAEPAFERAQRRGAPAKQSGGRALVGRRTIATAEQVASAARDEEIPPPLADRFELGVERTESAVALGALQLSGQ